MVANEGNVARNDVEKAETIRTNNDVHSTKARKPFGEINCVMKGKENIMKKELEAKITKQIETVKDEIKVARSDFKSVPKEVRGVEEVVEINDEKVEQKIGNGNSAVITSALGDNVQDPFKVEDRRCHKECDRKAHHNASGTDESYSQPIIEKTYLMDNLTYLQQREKTTFLDPNYLKTHSVVDNRKRSILVNWLIEVANGIHTSQETIFLTITYIDCFLSKAPIKIQEFQLLGVTALMIACKYEEIRGDFVGVSGCIFLTNNMYSRERIYDMELRILTVLRFDVGMPTTNTFMDIFSNLCEMDSEEMAAARYIAELALLQGEKTMRFLPSVQAASALLLGSCVADETDPAELELSKPFGFSLDELKPCMFEMLEIYRMAPHLKLLAVRAKYSVERYHSVSTDSIVL